MNTIVRKPHKIEHKYDLKLFLTAIRVKFSFHQLPLALWQATMYKINSYYNTTKNQLTTRDDAMKFCSTITSIFLLGSLAHSQAIEISGFVTDASGSPIYAARISLSKIAASTSSQTNGKYTFGPALGVQRRADKHAQNGSLMIHENRISLGFDRHAADGRIIRNNSAQICSPNHSASRASASPIDTIVVYWNSMPRIRIPISSYTATINIAIDTSLRPNDIPWNKGIPYGYLHDIRDGQVYRTVELGAMTWMAENLNYNHSTSWPTGITNDTAGKIGRQYLWTTAMGVGDEYEATKWSGDSTIHNGICPDGWRIPTFADWRALDTWISSKNIEIHTGNNKNGIKIKSTNGWQSLGTTSGNGSDNFGMRIIPEPGGYGANYITSSNSSKYIWTFSLNYGLSWIDSSSTSKKAGIERALRCIKNK